MKTIDVKLIAQQRATDPTDQEIVEKAIKEGIETAWDRLEKQQPQCGFGQLGVCCNNCAMGPCRIDVFGQNGPTRGVCGADVNTIVARNLLNDLLVGAAAHSDHGREVLEVMLATAEGNAQGYEITDVEKLKRVAREYKIEVENRDKNEIAKELALKMLEEFGTIKGHIGLVDSRVPEKTFEKWEAAGIVPRGVDREIVEGAHRVHMGVGADAVNMLLHALRISLSDGWGGSMMATEASDILFGTPEPNKSFVNLGVLSHDQVNVVLHGHNPILSEMIVKAANDPELQALAKEKGAKGINLVGMCCTGNELLVRHGIPIAGNLLDQELAIATGAVEAMVIDYQCIFPSITETAKCFHTKVIATSEKSIVPGAIYMKFEPETALDTAKAIVKLAIENYPNRNRARVQIPKKPMELYAGYSVESMKKMLGGSFQPLIDAIVAGKIKGVVGLVGCNNPKVRQDQGFLAWTKELIKRDILVLVTGCGGVAGGKAGLLVPEAAKLAGDGLRSVCEALNIPPVLHMGSCVDNSRILVLGAEIAKTLGVGIDQLPLGGGAPEWYSQKAISIAAYFVASGVYTILGLPMKIYGSPQVVDILTNKLNDIVNAAFAIEPDPIKAVDKFEEVINRKRKALGI